MSRSFSRIRPIFVLSAALVAGCCAAQQAKYKLIDAYDHEVGTATYGQKLNEDGTKRVTMTLTLMSGITIRKESTYDKDGHPTKMLEETNRGQNRVSVQVLFEGRVATMRRLDKPDEKSTATELDGTLPFADPTAFWFLREKPKAGAESICYSYSTGGAVWRLIKTVYKGDREVTVGEQKWKGHVLIVTANGGDSEIVVDDQGVPIIIDSTLKFERLPEPKTSEGG